ncbi:MAG TPA: hypothetical protein VJL78_07925 [Candidatus Nitrosocosmicus sp.]|nr:hypothetical protein [Candidatus Nitrosocosmicus sp.]
MQSTLSLQTKKGIKKKRPVRKSGGPRGDKKLRMLKRNTSNNIFKNQSLGLKILFESLSCVLNFYRASPFDILALVTIALFLLKKLLLLSTLVICRILDNLLNGDMNGN